MPHRKTTFHPLRIGPLRPCRHLHTMTARASTPRDHTPVTEHADTDSEGSKQGNLRVGELEDPTPGAHSRCSFYGFLH